MSSIAAGWLENWAVYRRLPEAIAGHRWGRFLGRRTMGFFSRFFTRNISGLGGNSALGLMLGMTPVMGKFFGLPLDVRHVTLSTGALTLAALALGNEALLQRGLLGSGARHRHHRSLRTSASASCSRSRWPCERDQADRSDRLRLMLSVLATFARSPFSVFHSATPKPRGTSSRTGDDSPSPGNLTEGFLS